MPAFATPFANGISQGKADALLLAPGLWRVFLFPSDGPTSFDVQAGKGSEAIEKAWVKLKKEREAMRRG